eukprot:6679516-Alexandrium_andersonii.AAC.1
MTCDDVSTPSVISLPAHGLPPRSPRAKSNPGRTLRATKRTLRLIRRRLLPAATMTSLRSPRLPVVRRWLL